VSHDALKLTHKNWFWMLAPATQWLPKSRLIIIFMKNLDVAIGIMQSEGFVVTDEAIKNAIAYANEKDGFKAKKILDGIIEKYKS
jgi:hypothetical protein